MSQLRATTGTSPPHIWTCTDGSGRFVRFAVWPTLRPGAPRSRAAAVCASSGPPAPLDRHGARRLPVWPSLRLVVLPLDSASARQLPKGVNFRACCFPCRRPSGRMCPAARCERGVGARRVVVWSAPPWCLDPVSRPCAPRWHRSIGTARAVLRSGHRSALVVRWRLRWPALAPRVGLCAGSDQGVLPAVS